jgi:hypothetical protein
VKIKTLTAVIAVAASALLLTGCSDWNSDASSPAGGFWTTVQANGNPVGDVWCVDGSTYKTFDGAGFSCDWGTFTDPGTHANARNADGQYRFLVGSDRREHKVLCIVYKVKGYRVSDCNWTGIRN